MTQRDINDIDGFLGTASPSPRMSGRHMGVIVGGSLSKGLTVRLAAGESVEDLAVGRYVVVTGRGGKRFFCMISDIQLDATNPAIQSDPPDVRDPFMAEIIMGTVVYGIVTVTPMLMIDEREGVLPVKTIPEHFTPVLSATQTDVEDVFGQDNGQNFHVGAPLELQETKVNLNLKRLVERSVGVFGKSGTGKSFLTRVLLAGVLARRAGVTLIFDMHNDYGWSVTSENGYDVKGLKQLFISQVSILTLDEESSRKRGAPYDFAVRLGYNEIEPEDIAMLKATMNLSDTMVDAAYTLARRWGDSWITRLLQGDPADMEEVAEQTNVQSGTLSALQRRLERFHRWKFLVEENAGDSVGKILDILVQQQKSVVLEFGEYGSILEAYMLVANYLTRRIHQKYVSMVEKAIGEGTPKPPNLVITIEEAHKFLEPQVARQTTFGIIAREMRKYNVTLLVVDQRPSAIDEEVMSQIGTRVTALLDNERDISAVLNGVSGASSLREVLARLETKQQAIIMGHAVPMPVVIKPRDYNDAFYDSVSSERTITSTQANTLLSARKNRL